MSALAPAYAAVSRGRSARAGARQAPHPCPSPAKERSLNRLDLLLQFLLPAASLASMLLVARRNRWGFVVGLAAQPAWAFTYVVHRQWGGLITCLLASGALALGIREWFAMPPHPAATPELGSPA